MKLYNRVRYHKRKLGKYVIEQSLGEGRYGLCFLASSDDGRQVVIKKFKRKIFMKTRPNREDNIDEAVILSKLNDERIPELLGIINENGFYGFVLEYKQGTTVKELIFKQGHKFTKEEFFDIGIQLIKIIEYLQSNGVVHRDIRIPNVLIDKGKVYLIDFGLARWADNEKYRYDLDFSFLGDFLVYLLYASYENEKKDKKVIWYKSVPWYDELKLTDEKKIFLKRLFGLEDMYVSINDLETDFIKAFSN